LHIDFVQALRDIAKEKDIPLEILGEILEAALVSAYKKQYGASSEIHVEIDWEESRVSVFARKLVIQAVEDPHTQMSIAEARRLDPGVQVGESMDIEVTPSEDFGRIAAQTAKQVVVQRIREAERDIVFREYSDRAGEVLTGVVQRREGRTVFVNLGKVDAFLPPSEQMPLDSYRAGERIKVYVVEVKKTTKTPRVLVSRSHPGLLRRLFELEVPEVHDGTVEIKSVAREAGARSKVGVWSRQQNVDPVGACVGRRGSRVQAVVDELRGEKIDIVRWDEDMSRYLASALSPAKVSEVRPDENEKACTIIVPDNQLSLAIGREGQNVRLAARLTGWRIDIRSESQLRGAAQAPVATALPTPLAEETPAAETADAAAGRGVEPPPHTAAVADAEFVPAATTEVSADAAERLAEGAAVPAVEEEQLG
jgi:N utilization substance protein A